MATDDDQDDDEWRKLFAAAPKLSNNIDGDTLAEMARALGQGRQRYRQGDQRRHEEQGKNGTAARCHTVRPCNWNTATPYLIRRA